MGTMDSVTPMDEPRTLSRGPDRLEQASLELEATRKVLEALQGLAPEGRSNVLEMVARLLHTSGSPSSDRSYERAPARERPESLGTTGTLSNGFATMAEFFAAGGPPRKGPEKALLVAAFLQERQPDELGGFGARAVGAALKDLGHESPNISATINLLLARRPAPIVQLRKRGDTRQAQKSFKITQAGLDFTRGLLSGGEAASEDD